MAPMLAAASIATTVSGNVGQVAGHPNRRSLHPGRAERLRESSETSSWTRRKLRA